MMGGGMDATGLLANKSVQDELKLSDDQKKDIKAANDARGKAMRKAFEDQDREAFAKINEDFTKAMKKVKDALTSAQAKRLFQIEVQVATKGNNPRIFQNPEVVKALKLTDAQQKKVKTAITEMEKDVKELFEDAKGDQKKMFQAFGKMRELSKEAYTTVAKALDDDQKKTLKSLEGEKFELKMEGGFFKKGKKGGKKEKKDDF
jgi:hypothetical protein